MKKTRKIRRVLKSRPTIEGAGVYLRRGFAWSEVPQFDPFLLLDDFRQDDPERYLPGFPWHPHRGIETITYMLRGAAEHGDSMGNKGVIGPEYLDVAVPPGASFLHPTKPGHTVIAYVFEGKGSFAGESDPFAYKAEGANYFDFERSSCIDDHTVVLFEEGEELSAAAARDSGFRFLLVSGKPLGEPIAWQGPIVMNTQEELRTAFREYRNGTFIKVR